MLLIAIVMLTIMLVFVIAVLFPGVIASGADGTQRSCTYQDFLGVHILAAAQCQTRRPTPLPSRSVSSLGSFQLSNEQVGVSRVVVTVPGAGMAPLCNGQDEENTQIKLKKVIKIREPERAQYGVSSEGRRAQGSSMR
ncbi:hypothetical protein [Aeromonas veronii]|uniref:hypothetical protein n=1 Tax=Aeromonas veronii TaxID=654 RepID=UPI001F2EB410|nr:hypothetical protein [Aeromonas veronii]